MESKTKIMRPPWSNFSPIWDAARKETDFWKCRDTPQVVTCYRDFVRIPELKKSDLKSGIESLTCKNIDISCYITTGGSTGEPLRLPMDSGNAPRVKCQQAKARSAYGIRYGERCFLIWGHSSGMGTGLRAVFERFKRKLKDRLVGYYRLSAYELGNEKLCAEFSKFLKFKPKWICGYSSAVVAFARANWDKRRSVHDLKLKVVLCSAEMLSPDEAKELLEFFGAPVALEYGSMEFGPIAYTRPDSEALHIMDDLLVEAIPTTQQHVYRLLVTSLYPRVVPMIRYDIGDQVKIYDPNFKGGVIQSFDEVLGRQNDIITFTDGTAAHSEAVTHAIKAHNDVLSFQFHKWKDEMELKLVVRPDADEAGIAERIRGALIAVNSGFKTIEVVFVEDVDVTPAGKRRWIVVHSIDER